MPWAPTTDFEEEIVNLQPDHDFIYGALSEPEPQQSYPRPKSHIEYAKNLKKQAQEQQEEYETTGRINEKLHIIAQVQRMAGTKPLGEQPTLEDWDSVKNVEKETIGMIRYCGLESSVEQPFNDKVTIATYPVRNDIEVVQSGRRKVPLFFDDNVFKLKPKVPNSSSEFESASSSNSNDFGANNDDNQGNKSSDTSFNTSTSSSFNTSSSFYTGKNDTADDLNMSKTAAYNKAQVERESLLLKAERLRQYDKLLEETASLSLSNSSRGNASFHTANDSSSSSGMRSVLYEYYDDDYDNSFDTNKTNWPALKDDFIPSKTWYNRKSTSNNNSFDSAQDQCCANDCSTNETSSKKSSNFLDRFIKPENNTSSTTSNSSEESVTAASSPKIPLSYANVTKSTSSQETVKLSQGAISKSKKKIQYMPRFFTAREIYERKHNGVQH